MAKLLLGVIAMTLGCGSADSLPAPMSTAAPREVRTVVVYTGVVDASTAERFLDVIGDNLDSVIGLDIAVAPSRDNDERYLVGPSDGRFVISAGDPLNMPREVVIGGDVGTTMDMTTVNGFYLIKSGGMHAAGAISYGARPVDEAALRLNPHVRIIRREIAAR